MQKFNRVTPTNVRHALESVHGTIDQGHGSSEPEALSRLASLLGTKAHKKFCEQAEPVLRRMSRKKEVNLKFKDGKIAEIKLVGYKPPKAKDAKPGGKKPILQPKPSRMPLADEAKAAGEYVADCDKTEPDPWEFIPEISPAGIAVTQNGQPKARKVHARKDTSRNLTVYR